METKQLSVLELPPQNVLEILPRFKIAIGTKDEESIAKFAEAIGEIRLDQLPDNRAGHGKSGKHLQANLRIEIKTSDRAGIEDNYAEQFEIGDRVVDNSPPHPHTKPKGFGQVMKIEDKFIYVRWDNAPAWHKYGFFFINKDKWLGKVEPEKKFLENPNNVDSFPEIFTSSKTQGYVEHYFVIGKNKRCYWYTRYVYQDISGKLRHHHISKKQTKAIAALWQSGASAKEICTAIGKKYLGKDSS
jgi:hypothetical protein